MIKLDLIKSDLQRNVSRAIKKRGLKLTAIHGVRRLGTMMERALVGPDVLRINPMGWICNHTCPMCWLQHLDPGELQQMKKVDKQEGMTLDEYRRLFAAMPPGLREVNVVGGGEPLVHKDAIEIFRAVKEHGWYGSLITNGSLLKAKAAEALIDMGWDSTRVSVHAGDAATYEAIQGVDNYDIVHENLRHLTAYRDRVGARERCELAVFHVIQKRNIPTIDKLFTFAEEVGADRIEFDPIIPYDDGQWLTADEIRTARRLLTEGAAASEVPCNAGVILNQLQVEEHCVEDDEPFVPAKRCSVGFDQAFITALGDVMPCCFSTESMGNIREQSFDQIWNGEKYVDFRKRLINGKFARYCIENRCTLPGVLHN